MALFGAAEADFTFKTDPLETSTSDFGVIGDEVNGKYYEETKG